MKVFISWSGDRSKEIAKVLKDWLPHVINDLEPWVSSEDINKGKRWSNEVAHQLEEARVGIICLTSENVNASWILFEAGALAKFQKKAYLCTYLLDLEPNDLDDPLAQFQATLANKEDTLKMLCAINKALGDKAEEKEIGERFEWLWPGLKLKLDSISESSKTREDPMKTSPAPDIIGEIRKGICKIKKDLQRMNYQPDLIISFSRSGATFASMLSGSMAVEGIISVGRHRREVPSKGTDELYKYEIGSFVDLKKVELNNKNLLIAEMVMVTGSSLEMAREYLRRQEIQCNLRIAFMYVPSTIINRGLLSPDVVYAEAISDTRGKLDGVPWLLQRVYQKLTPL